MDNAQGPARIGIIGAGNICRLHLDGIARHPDRVRVAALCDVNLDAARARAAECGGPAVFDNPARMLAAEPLDAAIVCTPTHVRREVLAVLIQARVPTLVEKPFAETYAEAADIERTARAAGVPVAVNQNFRRHFAFDLARQVLARGELGRPLQLVQTQGYFRTDVGWRLDRRRYVMSVMSIHWFDGYRFMLGDEPVSVYARSVNSPATPGGDDTGVCVLIEFKGGTIASLSESFASFAKPDVCGLDCEAGGLVLGYKKLIEIRPNGQRIEHANPMDKADATYWLLDDLLTAAADGRPPDTAAADNLKSMRMLEAAYRSLELNRPVRIEEIE